ncbi:MAG TPA: tetratricopeptide repeat protein [Bryobacteraceae bacterium]|nr:tetratricopeptide repeat protein [Bryobacteraceae bacterium]
MTRPLLLALCAAVFPAVTAHAAGSAPALTFYKQIAPIIYKNCAPCHRPDESGPFSLLTYDDVKRRATQIAAVTKRRYMPPWLPEKGYGDFLEERRLSDAQIELIQEWVKQGAPVGSAADGPAVPRFTSEWQLGTPDLVLHVTQPYQLRADGPEVFWNFIIPVPLKSARWVKAIEIRPGNARVIHHASVIVDRSRSARRRENSPGAGFAGMDLTVAETTFDPDSTFLAWKPGSVPAPEPDGMAWRADPGMDLVFNVHLRPSGKAESVSPSIGLYFADAPRTKFAMLMELEHDGAIDIPPGEREYVVSDDFRIPLDLRVLAVYPHAHYLGKLMEGYATLPDGTRKWLVRIPEWDLNWQGVFHCKEPVYLPRGTVISMRFHYDNSADNARNPNKPPKRVRGGSQAKDEMGNLWLQVLPVEKGDQRAVLQDALMRRLYEKYPGDFTANFNLGDLLLGKGKAAEAIPYFERAWKAQPRSALAATELGTALASAARMPEGIQMFRKALELDPKFTDARYDLASAEAASRQWDSAVDGFRQVLKERPDDAKARQHLGEVLFTWGDDLAGAGNPEAAVARYREALTFRPDDAELHTNLGVTLAQLRRFKEAQAELEAALRLDPSAETARKALAAVRAQIKVKGQ